MRQVRLPHVAAANLIGHGDFGADRTVFGFVATSPPFAVRLFGYVARLAAADSIDDIFVTELEPQQFLSYALADSSVRASDEGEDTYRSPALIVDVSDFSGRPLLTHSGPRWTAGLRSETLPTDVGRLRLFIYPARELTSVDAGTGSALDASRRLLLVLALFGITVLLSVMALLQLRSEQQLARRRALFVSGVSHELRTPLAQIRLFAELLRDERPAIQEKRYHYARIIDEEAQRLTYIVDNVLTFSALADVRSPVLRSEVSLSSLVTNTVEWFAPLAASRAVRLQVTVADDVIVLGDEGMLRRTLQNVLDNAVKYGPAGQTISIVLNVTGDLATLIVDDEGPGIPAADRARVFEPFVRLQSGGGAQPGGSGIGLSIVRDLMSELHGAVTIEASPAGGARVRLELHVAAMVTA